MKISVICGQNSYTHHFHHIQHLRCCAIVGALLPPVTPAAIHIQVLRTLLSNKRCRHYAALIDRSIKLQRCRHYAAELVFI